MILLKLIGQGLSCGNNFHFLPLSLEPCDVSDVQREPRHCLNVLEKWDQRWKLLEEGR